MEGIKHQLWSSVFILTHVHTQVSTHVKIHTHKAPFTCKMSYINFGIIKIKGTTLRLTKSQHLWESLF